MQICSKCHASAPDEAANCPNCGANLWELSATAIALKRLQENPRVIYVRISEDGQCCPVCREALETYYDTSPANNPTGPDTGCMRSVRGGSWDDDSRRVRVALRGADYDPVQPYFSFGFRCAITP